MTKGQITVNTDNLLPIIKKWLYSDKDIFLREIVSNAQDAIMKVKKLSAMGECNTDGEEFEIHVTIDKEAKTLTVSDNGIGMTEDEVEKYINQVAFSGAEEFMKKYEESSDENGKIIGHFGLGFYSAFMASSTVEIDTLSYRDGAKPVHWVSDGGTEYEIGEGARDKRGTKITLHIAEDSEEYLEYGTVLSTLTKYCGFLPVKIYLEDTSKEKDDESQPSPINDTTPLWLKNPSDCTDEEYKQFYAKTFFDFNEPLFWIHLNVDFPFNLKGILYFPKLGHELQSIEGQIKLFNNQVYIADNIKEVIPEYLMLLKGVIDCPDLPLNVSRSFLQNDGYVAKVSSHIVKKVSDKLSSLFKSDRESYNRYWDDINPFIKYGCLRDEKFYDRVKDILLFKTLDGQFITLKELSEGESKEIYYVTDEDSQSQYIALLKADGKNMVLLPDMIDNHFVSFLEYKVQDIKFKRVDSYVGENTDSGADESDSAKQIADIFKSRLGGNTPVEVHKLSSGDVAAIFVLPEEARRMEEMSKMFGGAMMNMPAAEEKLVVNSESSIVSALKDVSDEEIKNLICDQLIDMARLSHKTLSGDALNGFISRSNLILAKLIEK